MGYETQHRDDVLIDVPEHHEIAGVLLAVEFALGEVTGPLAGPDLFMDLHGPCLQYRAGGLGHIDLCFSVVGGHGGWRGEGGGGFQNKAGSFIETW